MQWQRKELEQINSMGYDVDQKMSCPMNEQLDKVVENKDDLDISTSDFFYEHKVEMLYER